MATQSADIPLTTAEKLSTSNLINNKNLFAKVSQRFGLLPGAQGLNDISQVIEEGTQTLGSGSPLDQVRREAEVVADDVILNFGKEDLKKAPNKFCKTMRRTVKELSSRHDIAFKGMVNKLNLDSNNPFQTFVNVADEIFDDGQINWGRIVAVYAFAARLATRETDKSDFPKKIALFVGKYVANKLGKWILDHGGWEAFAEYFPDQGEIEDTMWKGLLFTAVGLGALASVVATR
ncbi:anti-apoptotic protein NR13-like [Babylonia areolata]|uniref:anti-apoptotic protein NR13-like n=1 Tax=Babylonia areolata TaxID=304850 RepID=UPI003FD2B01C